jgi:hypothetical protein
MTNQQLTLLIRSFRKRLSTEISRLRDALPEGSARREQLVFTGEGLASKHSTPTTDPRHWVSQQSGDYVALSGLVDLLADLDEATEILSAGERPPVNKE